MPGEPRLWGAWEPLFHPSGTCMVVLASGDQSRPHFYVFADPLPNNRQQGQRNRRVMCWRIAEFMSGTGERPVWLDDFYLRKPHAAESLTGAMILTVGPWVPAGSQGAGWLQDYTPKARRARKALLAALLRP